MKPKRGSKCKEKINAKREKCALVLPSVKPKVSRNTKKTVDQPPTKGNIHI